ncbi:MAG TPA: hypothetical protein VGQ36_17960 [Thermoanaerobaculia bacterium]|jgi:hypothetical protein|nr:hypothetical protein [Thermoanaerobaculia bacterium]
MKLEHERALMLDGARASSPRTSAILAEAAKIPHRTHGILLRITLFVLTLVGVLGLNFFLDQIDVPRQGIAAGILAILVAEILINARHWFWTGVEEALWIGGIYSLISELPSTGTPESNLVLGGAAAIAGARVRNPLFGALAAGFFAYYFERRFDLGVVAALIIALVAAFALLRTWRRPSNEFLCIAIAVTLPIAGYFAADAVWRNATIALYAAFGAATIFLAIRYRHHALFLAGGIGVAIAAIEFARTLDLPLEAKLAAGGALLLAGAWIAARALRDRTTGIVATPAKLTSVDDELEIAATVALPQQEFEPKAESGGEFGGAGATGKY